MEASYNSGIQLVVDGQHAKKMQCSAHLRSISSGQISEETMVTNQKEPLDVLKLPDGPLLSDKFFSDVSQASADCYLEDCQYDCDGSNDR